MRSFFLIMFVPLVWACSHEPANLAQWSREQSRTVLDSLGNRSLGCFEEPTGFFIIEFEPNQRKPARKLTYRKGFPLYIDTLAYIKPNEFKSAKEDATYLIKDTCVICINYVKIFHPNSNLKGQTPWVQPYVNTYKRLDK